MGRTTGLMTGIKDRKAYLRESMEITLTRLEATAEGGRHGQG